MRDSSDANPWILLIHHLPPKPDYFRVRIRRRLQQLGAVAVKNAVYVLPASDQSLEDFQWLAEEIRQDGGVAIIAEARFLGGLTDADLAAQFAAQSGEAYGELVTAAREAIAGGVVKASVISGLAARLEQVAARDQFGAPERAAAEAVVGELKRQQELERVARRTEPQPARAVWVTRLNVFVDRIASAWLIRRFIDRDARFKFVPAAGYVPLPGEIRFDMFGGEYGHEGDNCTFETLVRRFELESDPGLRQIAEIVHDLDLRDEKYGRPEAAGVLALLQGITTRYASDAERIEQGRRIFDQLYSSFARSG